MSPLLLSPASSSASCGASLAGDASLEAALRAQDLSDVLGDEIPLLVHIYVTTTCVILGPQSRDQEPHPPRHTSEDSSHSLASG